jgi:hypothetical protein
VLRKCANPVCYVPFRYLHQGKLLEVEIQFRERRCGKGTSSSGKRYVERYWLCDQCVVHVALHFDRRRGVVLISSLLMASLKESTETTATSILQFHQSRRVEIVRVLIRPSDLGLKSFIPARTVSGPPMFGRQTL